MAWLSMTGLVLLSAALAAAMAGLGVIPLVRRRRIPTLVFGWANAVAAGFMLGVAYLLMHAGLGYAPLEGAIGAVLGIASVWVTKAVAGTADLDLNRLGKTSETHHYKVLLVDALHASWEGIAIGAAMAVGMSFGVFMALAIGLHNVAEGAMLSAVLRSRGRRPGHAAALTIAVEIPLILLGVATFVTLAAAPAAVPWTLGFAFGALVYLVIAELLLHSYRQAGRTSIALVTMLAMGIVVLLGLGG